MLKKLLFIILFFSSLLISKDVFSQCDILYNAAGNSNDTCLIAGNDINISYPSIVIFQIKDVNNNIITNANFVNSFLWINTPNGEYTINVLDGTTFIPICSNTIIIAPGLVTLPNPMPVHFDCQGNTINLEDLTAIDLQNGGTNTQYTFDISGVPINGVSYYINNAGITTINVTATTSSGCTVSSIITIDADPTNISLIL